jgi:GT2 family glycosyltransferase
MAMAAGSPIVSVCIANYNGIGMVGACIESVLAQDWQMPVEIIVHDDASSDGSVDFIRSRYPAVTMIESTDNVGFCVANNRMAATAHGEYLLLLNNDALLLPDALPTLLAAAEGLNRPAIFGLPQYDAQSGKLLDIGSVLDPFLNPVPNLDPERGEVGMVMGACLWIPRSLWQDLGGFPEWFGSIGEDLYLCCLARLWGYSVRVLGTSGYRHHVGQSFGGGKVTAARQLSTTKRRRALSERNKSAVMVLCYPTLLLAILLPLHLGLLVVEGMALSLCKCDLQLWSNIYWNCLRFLFGNASRLLRERRFLQARRAIGLRSWLALFDWMPYKLRMLARHGLPEIRA